MFTIAALYLYTSIHRMFCIFSSRCESACLFYVAIAATSLAFFNVWQHAATSLVSGLFNKTRRFFRTDLSDLPDNGISVRLLPPNSILLLLFHDVSICKNAPVSRFAQGGIERAAANREKNATLSSFGFKIGHDQKRQSEGRLCASKNLAKWSCKGVSIGSLEDSN